MNEKSVCIIILNYRNSQLTIDFVRQLKNINYSNYKTIVVDNYSNDGTIVSLREESLKLGFILIENKSNLGYAKGNNVGLKYALSNDFDYSWIVNNDLIISDLDILKKLVKKISSDKTIGAIGPKIYDTKMKVCAPYLAKPTLINTSIGAFFYKRKRTLSVNSDRFVYRIHGCCMLVDNVAMSKSNMFDENTFLYCEENILAERMSACGYKFFYLPSASIIHMESSTVGKNKGFKSVKKIKWTNNSLSYYLKHYLHKNLLYRFFMLIFNTIIIFCRG